MDKVALMGFIEDLGLDPDVEGALLKYIEDNEVSPELMESIAKALEMQADGEDLIRDQLLGEVEVLEGMTEDLKSIGEENKTEVNKVMENFLSKVETAAKKVSAPAETPAAAPAPVTPAYSAPATNMTAPVPAATPAAPFQAAPAAVQNPFAPSAPVQQI